jgi:hypothetical protein
VRQRKYIVTILFNASNCPSDWGWKAVDMWWRTLKTEEPEQFALEVACERGVAVTDDGSRQAVEPDDVGEEGARHRCHRVGMAELNEMGVHEKPIHHGENHRFAADFRQRLDEIHGDISPYGGWYLQRLKESSWMKVVRLVALARQASVHVVLYNTACAGNEERLAQTIGCLLIALVAVLVYGGQHLLKARRGRR